jgi:hypothetical protein
LYVPGEERVLLNSIVHKVNLKPAVGFWNEDYFQYQDYCTASGTGYKQQMLQLKMR